MRRELLIPKLGLTMTEGTVVEWPVAPGESFKAGQVILLIESEKAAVEVPAEAEGVMMEILAKPGATLPVGETVAYWDDGVNGGATAPASAAATPAPVAARCADAGTAPAASVCPAHVDGIRVPVTPLARRIAAQRGIDLAQVHGTGPRGRIRARDLDSLVPAVAPAIAPASGGSLRQPTDLEQTIARRLTAAKQEIPHFYLSVEAEVSNLLAFRRELNAAQSAVRFTLNHFIVAAVGRALIEMPHINRVWTDNGILSLASSDVGMAVDTERGLLVPVLHDVGSQPLSAVARAATVAIERAQAGRLSAEEMTGGAITVSNAGMHDVTWMSSIINPGQAMILGVGSVRELFRPDADGQPVLRREMGMVLSADHRVLDGVNALGFLRRVVQLLAQPLALLVS